MELFKIEIVAFKTFYIEAESQEDTLQSEIVRDEESVRGCGDAEWGHSETTAVQQERDISNFILKKHPEQILG